MFSINRNQWLKTERKTNVHPLPNARIGERVPHKPLPNQKAENRNGPRFMFNGKTNKNLVPEPADEVEKRDSSHQRTKRTREASSSPESSSPSGRITSSGSKLGKTVFLL